MWMVVPSRTMLFEAVALRARALQLQLARNGQLEAREAQRVEERQERVQALVVLREGGRTNAQE